MKVVILCGGLGTRLREETEYRPKPMVPVGGRPVLWHIMKYYAHFGHKDFILCLGYKGDVIKDYFRNYLWHTSDVTLLETGLETQTGGRLRRALAHVTDDTFLFTYGDGLTNSDVNASVRFHLTHGAIATITAVKPSGRFGELAMDGQTITAFREKPEQESSYISGGFMVLNRRVGEYIDPEDSCSFEKAPLERLANAGQLKAHCHDGFWQCMDTYREQQLLEGLWRSGNAPWKVW